MPSAAASVALLREEGVPPVEAITTLKNVVGSAPRAWVRDFKIRGGRCASFTCTEV